MRKKSVKANLATKSGKLWMEVNSGKSPKEAAKVVGIDPKNVGHMMRTEAYQALERSSYKEELIKHITLAQIAEEHMKVMTQDKDLGAKNTAIKMALEKIEPENAPQQDQEKIIVFLK